MSPLHSWLLIGVLCIAAWVLVQLLVAVDEGICRLIARLYRRWQAHRLEQQQEQFRTRRGRVRTLTRRAYRA